MISQRYFVIPSCSFFFLILDNNDKIDLCDRKVMEEDTVMSNKCVLGNILDTCSINKKYGLKELSVTQKSTIVCCTHERQYEFYTKVNAEISTW